MTNVERASGERAGDGGASPLVVNLRVATWRYIGDRDDADRAYCARFGVKQAPEPAIALGGAWAYTLPATEASR